MSARAVLVSLAVAVAALACAAVALAATTPSKGTFKGTTEQGYLAKVRVDKQHRVKRFEINWRAPCDGGGTWLRGSRAAGTTDRDLKNDPIKQDGDGHFSDSGTYEDRTQPGLVGHVTVKFHGRFPDKTHAKGDFDAKVRVTKNGKTVDHCHANVTWAASLP